MLLALLLACAPAPAPACTDEAPTEGGIKATIDGVVWAAVVQWNLAGTGIQFTSAQKDGYRISLVALVDDQGRTAAESLEELPATFLLQDSSGSASVTPEQGESSATSKGGGGSLSIAEQADDDLVGCFSFTAGTSSGTEVLVEAGSFWASPLAL